MEELEKKLRDAGLNNMIKYLWTIDPQYYSISQMHAIVDFWIENGSEKC